MHRHLWENDARCAYCGVHWKNRFKIVKYFKVTRHRQKARKKARKGWK